MIITQDNILDALRDIASAVPFDPNRITEAATDLARSLDELYGTAGTITPLPKFTDLMIDMEGLNCTPDSAPAQIALLFFNRDNPSTIPCSYTYEPSPISAIRLGFTVTADTLKWWDDQGMIIDVQHGEPLPDVLDEIASDISLHATRNLRVWSRGNTYDLAILKLAYARTGKTLPWGFTNERDVRTWLEGYDFKSTRKNNHDARTDALNQTLDILQAMHGLAAINPASVSLLT